MYNLLAMAMSRKYCNSGDIFKSIGCIDSSCGGRANCIKKQIPEVGADGVFERFFNPFF